jgi:hypothetical protein
MDSSIGAMPKIKIPMMAIISKIIELLALIEKKATDWSGLTNWYRTNGTGLRDRAVTVTISETKMQ